jgi:CRISPR/Cas system-associated exonuclease Cas4 (RecB family)
MDLVEAQAARADNAEKEDLFTALEVCPVDYKAGAPKEGAEASELWDTDKMQLGLQALILRDNGYTCNEGIIYYRTTKQRVRLPITPELENWIFQNITEARRARHRAATEVDCRARRYASTVSEHAGLSHRLQRRGSDDQRQGQAD